MSDYHFSKDATFYHTLKNSEKEPCQIHLQEYFIGALKPYMHELKITMRSLKGKSQSSVMPRKEYKSNIEFLKKDEGLADSVISIQVEIPPETEIIVQLGIAKHL